MFETLLLKNNFTYSSEDDFTRSVAYFHHYCKVGHYFVFQLKQKGSVFKYYKCIT